MAVPKIIQELMNAIQDAALHSELACMEVLNKSTRQIQYAIVIVTPKPDGGVSLWPVSILTDENLTESFLPPYPGINGAFGNEGQEPVYPETKGEEHRSQAQTDT